MDASPLKEAGLTDGEIKAYIALLELGPSTTGPIIDRSGIARSIIYQILEKLIQKGLVSYIIKTNNKHYQAAEPTKILEYIDDRSQKITMNRQRVAAILPELVLKQAMAPRSEATIYSGTKGLQTMTDHIYLKLKKGDELLLMGIPAVQPPHLERYWRKDHDRRAKLGISCRLLINKGASDDVITHRRSAGLIDARIMPEGMVTPAGIIIYADTTSIILQDPIEIAVEIVNQEIADSFRSYFEDIWKRSKK